MSINRIFGPVPSRRLGRSIGINNIPPKICSYSCVYCQIGYSLKMSAEPAQYFPPAELAEEVFRRIYEVESAGEKIDYLTIVPDGEPTLDANIGELLILLKKSGIKTAVITNSTLLNHKAVRESLYEADWVSVKVDSADENTWRKIDKPHRSVIFSDMLDGIEKFSSEFTGTLATETMMCRGLNDREQLLKANASFIRGLKPDSCYISIPTRPPADKHVKPPEENSVNRAFQIYAENGLPVEYLIGYEGNEFSATGNAAEDILSITSVHPMREDAVNEFLKKSGTGFSLISKLLEESRLICTEYNNEKFYMRKIRN